MKHLYIDANAVIGRPNIPQPLAPTSLEELLADLDRADTAAAIVCRAEATACYYGKANEDLLVQAGPRIFPIITLPAAAARELGRTFDDLLGEAKRRGAVGVKLAPSAFGEPLLSRLYAPLCRAMLRAGLPAVVSIAHVDLAALDAFCAAFPDLPLLLTDASWGAARAVWGLMEAHANMHVECSSFHCNEIAALLHEAGLGERLMFGSGWPNREPAPVKALIAYADVPDCVKEAIAYGNACRFFGISTGDLVFSDWRPVDEYDRAVHDGLPLPEPALDAHGHMVADGGVGFSYVAILRGEAAGMAAEMDRLGIAMTVVSPWEGLSSDAVGANATSLAAANNHPGRFLGYGCYNPNYPDTLDACIAALDEPCIVGIKPYWIWSGHDADSPGYAPWFEAAAARNMLCLWHCDDAEHAKQAVWLAKKYPGLQILLAHSGRSYRVAEHNLAAARQAPNIHLEITFTSIAYGVLEHLVRGIGAERVLFGTDAPMRDPAPQVAWVAQAKGLSVAEKKLVFGENLERLLEAVQHFSGGRG